MRFGNTFTTIRRGIRVMTAVGVTIGAVGLIVSITHRTLDHAWCSVVLLACAPPVLFFSVCAPTLLFSIRVENGRVKHLLLDRYVLSDFPLADFERVEMRKSVLPVVIVFTQDRSIHFVGAHLGVVANMRDALLREKRANKSVETTRGTGF